MLFTGYSCGVVSNKASEALRPFMIYCMSLSEFWYPWFIRQTSRSEARRWREMSLNFADVAFQSYHTRIFNMPYNLKTWGLWLYFPSDGRCAADFYRPLKINRLGRDPSGKHTNHYTTEATRKWCHSVITCVGKRYCDLQEAPCGVWTLLLKFLTGLLLYDGPWLTQEGKDLRIVGEMETATSVSSKMRVVVKYL